MTKVTSTFPVVNTKSYSPFATRHLPGLDGLRAIAVIVVVLSHFLSLSWLPDGQFGVLLFFVLSGFLITWLLLKEMETSGTIALSDFYRRRAWRILPAFYLASFLALYVGKLNGLGIHWKELAAASLFGSNYFYAATGQASEKLLGVTWSLSVEEQFYLLWPCILRVFRHRLRVLRYLLLLCIFLVWVYRSAGWNTNNFSYFYTLYAFETRADALLLGAFVALSISEGMTWWQKISNPWGITLIGAGLTLWSVLSSRMGVSWLLGPGLIGGSLFSGALVVQSITLAPALLTSRIVSWVGKLSYSIYLFHTTSMGLAIWLLPHSKFKIIIPIGILFTILFSTGCYYFVEEPLRRRRRAPITFP